MGARAKNKQNTDLTVSS